MSNSFIRSRTLWNKTVRCCLFASFFLVCQASCWSLSAFVFPGRSTLYCLSDRLLLPSFFYHCLRRCVVALTALHVSGIPSWVCISHPLHFILLTNVSLCFALQDGSYNSPPRDPTPFLTGLSSVLPLFPISRLLQSLATSTLSLLVQFNLFWSPFLTVISSILISNSCHHWMIAHHLRRNCLTSAHLFAHSATMLAGHDLQLRPRSKLFFQH